MTRTYRGDEPPDEIGCKHRAGDPDCECDHSEPEERDIGPGFGVDAIIASMRSDYT